MECNCSPDSHCKDTADLDDAVTGLWLSSNSVLMGALTVAGYLLYRFSQTLPALIRWPIRIFCTLTGLSALWSWVSRVVGTLRAIQSLCKWLSQIWRFIVALFSKVGWLLSVIKAILGPRGGRMAETEIDQTSNRKLTPSPDFSSHVSFRDPGLRLILLGPSGGGRTSLADTLLGCSAPQAAAAPTGLMMESTRRTAVVDGRELTLVDTPDLLGASLGDSRRAREALRSLQLTSPGPHALLLVVRAPGSSMRIDQDTAEAIQTTLELFGDGVAGHLIPVLTHADHLGPRQTLELLLDENAGHLKTALVLCGQRAELVANSPACHPEVKRVMCRRLVGRVVDMRALRGHFVHELQRREDRIREELLADMASALARKLGHM
ncbi:GTPase IMAP family member 4-like [Myripristis murdjan]|uniref:GTPase IMAP family member 4-like n=1 Tax=Myripristis murdjan TaxID=586833 RepID=UPI00117621FB|nr:GTPase IMAP family member 4-like [Myripristis murdjan]